MTQRTLKASLPEDVERNKRWISAAFRACVLHDAFVDVMRIHNNIELEAGCRSTTYTNGRDRPVSRSAPSPLAKGIEATYKIDPTRVPLKDCLLRVWVLWLPYVRVLIST